MVPKQPHQEPIKPAILRARAEAQIDRAQTDGEDITLDEMQSLMHELHVHEIELELQNEELRRTQLELARSLDHCTNLFNLTPVGYLTIDRKGNIRDANRTAASKLGIGLEQLKQSKIWHYVARESRDEIYRHLRQTFEDPARQRCEIEMQRPDRSGFFAYLVSVAIDTEDEACCLTAMVDISDRKLAENAMSMLNIDLQQSLNQTQANLKDSITELHLIKSAVADVKEGIMITGDGLDWPDPTIIYVNPAMCRISGYSSEQLIGKTPRILECDCINPNILAHITAELHANRQITMEFKQCRKDGTIYDAETSISPLFDNNGHRTNFVAIHRDITARKRAEHELRENEARLNAIFDTAVEAIITTDDQGVIERANPAVEKMFGYDANELLGCNVDMLMPSPFREEHKGYIAEHLKTGIRRVIGRNREAVACRKDGSVFPISLSVNQVTGTPLFAGFIQDLTEIKALQKQVLDAAAEEDRRIGQELHDNLQQQLTGLRLLTSSMRDSLTEKAPDLTDRFSSLEEGLSHALNQLRSISRGLIPVDVDAAGLAFALEQLTESICLGACAECEFHNEGQVQVKDNMLATHLYRIAQEAVNNVVKHADATRLEITLKGDGKWVTMEIEDNGIGADCSYQQESGLGLRMMRYRAQLIGADIYIGPGKHGGTRVCCTLQTDVAVKDNPPLNR